MNDKDEGVIERKVRINEIKKKKEKEKRIKKKEKKKNDILKEKRYTKKEADRDNNTQIFTCIDV